MVKDIRKISFPSQSFDGIIAFYSLIHVPKKPSGQNTG
ncbi:class I SAM-dependent methyltransferase [Candidatus Micrarchaeota archaeon]|nr:class I SAM-dependent methyltransferase [Candidatus Micrarchaeota archaeon]